MTEKTFEEEKPFSVYKYELPDGCKKEIALYNIQQIKKHYLDKRRVREAIERLEKEAICEGISMFIHLKKELGLED